MRPSNAHPENLSVGTRIGASRHARSLSQVKPAVSPKDRVLFRRALLGWYDKNCRKLPWRETRDPYRIWLSEVMLQQTRVAAVLEHYRIFLERFPTIHALAATSEDAVLAAWSGLGYYRRARMLHKCAQQIVAQNDGCFPQNSQTLQALPGIGRYTAAAIASISFAEPVAVVDGNVERVLQRVAGRPLTEPQTWQCAQTVLDVSRPGDFNQAMMELGATICLPREPSCEICPIRKWCATQGEGQRTEFAPRQQRKEIWCTLECYAADSNGNRSSKVRLVRRPKKIPLMPGMWELPQLSAPPQRSLSAAPWRTFRHSITVTDYTVHVLRNLHVLGRGPAPSRECFSQSSGKAAKGTWIAIDRIPQMPITGLTRKILKAGGII